jgi:hypothetical protein
MHRNTYLLVTILAIFAALVVGVNLGRKNPNNSGNPPKAMDTPPSVPTLKPNTYTNVQCGFTLEYPTTLTKLEDASGSAVFVAGQADTQAFAVTCQNDIPRPPLPADKIEAKRLTNSLGTASVSARLYHDASRKDGTPIDSLIFQSPTTGLDAYIAGFGEVFDEVIASIKLIP